MYKRYYIYTGTYDLQNLHIAASNRLRNGDVELSVEFATNSMALGWLVVIANTNGTREFTFVKYRNDDSTTDGFTITGLPPASYNVAAFDLEGSTGLPGRYAAANASFTINEQNDTIQYVAADTGMYVS